MNHEKPIRLHITKHPDKAATERFESLVGVEAQQQDLIDHLVGILDPEQIRTWEKKHHPRGLGIVRRLERRPPLVILAGDVGCGKTELATSVGTPVARALEGRVRAFETPSDIRGGGHVGELSLRITAAFDAARAELGNDRGILVIDEGDDLATSREQNQAHHEDHAGVNVLIKQIDALASDRVPLGVILVTNRLTALDPALVRRAHIIRFSRPTLAARRALFERMLEGVAVSRTDLDALVTATERETPFTYSDLITRIAEPAVRRAIRERIPLSLAHLLEIAKGVEPTPVFNDSGI
jgi:SpoVK/Ycf46/Vps4 family AAA+-type ATPase